MAFRVIKQRREARRNAKLEEIFLVIHHFSMNFLTKSCWSGEGQTSKWDNLSGWHEGCFQNLWGTHKKILNFRLLKCFISAWFDKTTSKETSKWRRIHWKSWFYKMLPSGSCLEATAFKDLINFYSRIWSCLTSRGEK